MAEKSKNSQLAQKIKDGMGGNVGSIGTLLDALIGECHKDSETARGEEVFVNQGEVKGYRRLHSLLTKQKKTS